ncbi:ferric reductase-like transmembrane domain-containing protein [Cnuibacter physcomitrellae]|uniref:ferredoxin reductase family protein n=1 Tax=Cnuibacter physcomitrellae TaxID=1619308 RepID=UPI002175A280|nr:ferric reductase-like transmembrane domain-containing protein [Cnuibacter physcomitrellae]MCS5496641.1 ferric reductase-like transmembrane domain-containing protein [Cnuibacter physcomitrellae]
MAGIRGVLRRRSRGAFVLWIAIYTVLAVLPLPLGRISLDPGRGFWINLSVALGFVGLAMFGLQFVMAARSFLVVHPVGMDVVLDFHKQMAYLATLLVFAHPIILFVVDTSLLGLLDVVTSPLRAKFAVGSVILLIVLIVMSVFRRRLRIRYETWQATHAVLAVAVVVTALLHVLLVGYYVREWWEQTLWIAYSAAFIALGVWVRLVKPLVRRHRKWVVESIEDDVGSVTTVTLRLLDPTSYAPHRFHFDPGQFAWLQARRSPFSLSYHPFSISSSALHPHRIRFSIKAHDGFSREIGDLVPGDTVYVDGPFGAFVLPDTGPVVFVGAGVGVTPLLGMLETLADRGDDRECVLWLGNRSETEIPCLEQIEALQARMDLRVVHVLSKGSAGWTGERGHVDAALVARLLPDTPPGSSFCICGPDAMMDQVEAALAAGGVRRDAIHSERFGMV